MKQIWIYLPCEKCHGKGFIPVEDKDYTATTQVCPLCSGSCLGKLVQVRVVKEGKEIE
jgi:DnaJ-class molecular chaperone